MFVAVPKEKYREGRFGYNPVMPSYRLLKHRQYDRSVDRLPLAIQHKAVWSQVLLVHAGAPRT